MSSYTEPTLEQFSSWITPIIQESEDEEFQWYFGYTEAFRKDYCYQAIRSELGNLDVDWETLSQKLPKLLYALYLSHVDSLRIDPGRKKLYYRCWDFVKTSSELMELPFFEDLFSTLPILTRVQKAFKRTTPECLEEFVTNGITPSILCNATSKELKRILNRNNTMTDGAKLHLLWIHRHYCT